MPSRERIILWAEGASSDIPNTELKLGYGSYNLFPDGKGYLQNYPGRTDVFVRLDDYEVWQGTPPDTTDKITRIIYFRDVLGYPHLVFVQNGKLREKTGNGYRELYTLQGQTFDGEYFPHLFVHESKLVIVNGGAPPLVWDGVHGVCHLGVQEAPPPPDTRACQAPGSDFDCHLGLFAWYHFWWPGETPPSGPGSNVDMDGNYIQGLYTVRVQYVDIFGNKGPVSSPSRVTHISSPVERTPTAGDSYEILEYLTSDWIPPSHETSVHVAGYIVGRTLNLHPLDPNGGAAAASVHFTEKVQSGIYPTRFTHQATDATIAASVVMDITVHGPPQARGGTSWKGRVYLWGLEDSYILTRSDALYPGQFRDDDYRARSPIRVVVGAGDRLLVISTSSIEVLYETEVGLAVLSQDFSEGSEYGLSFVQVSETTVFGRFNRGFGFFDGTGPIKYVKTPEWLLSSYVDPLFYLPTAKIWGNFYVLSARLNMVDGGNNHLLLFDLSTQSWFPLKERAFDMTVVNGLLLGVDDSIYALFHGTPSESVAVVDQWLPPGGLQSQRSIVGVSLLMEPSSVSEAELKIQGHFSGDDSTSENFFLLPSLQSAGREDHLATHWGQAGVLYSDGPRASAPGDFWLSPDGDMAVAGHNHTLLLKFPEGYIIRLKALALDVSTEKPRGY